MLGVPELRPARLREMDQAALRTYAALSGDLNPIHLDREQAIRAGHPGLICHGMLAMTDIGGWLTHAMAGWRLVDYACRFVAPMAVGTRLQVTACGGEPQQEDGLVRVGVELVARDAEGIIRVTGRADFERSRVDPR
ncbi:dehydratase [Billgrantia sulfidoxydans]|uniref:Dehydratase n=1 Tax=Billgrantia sulfidoxydans TaxID=2733484 RepID=A0ABX7W9M8_9GAMM|nr:MaoC/PaaZ C-terminal domain-containing protein [Halomonas sulfidoxydans]QTP56550.1 dehydratase [Halomonas sulfidoxydans]